MANINLGNVVGNSVIGISSNLDSVALIDGLSAIRKRPIDDLTAKIETNSAKTAKFFDLKNLLNTLQTSVKFLRNSPDGSLNPYSNVFDYRTSSLSSSTLTSS